MVFFFSVSMNSQFKKSFIYFSILFLVALGFPCSGRLSPVAVSWSCSLISMASLVAEHGL